MAYLAVPPLAAMQPQMVLHTSHPTDDLMIPLRILIIDDSPEFIQAATLFIEQVHQAQYVVGALDARTALEELKRIRPHLVLVDLSMPGVNGLETTRMIKTEWVAVRVVLLSVEDTKEHRQAAAEAGADAYISKSEFASKFMPTVANLFGGKYGDDH